MEYVGLDLCWRFFLFSISSNCSTYAAQFAGQNSYRLGWKVGKFERFERA